MARKTTKSRKPRPTTKKRARTAARRSAAPKRTAPKNPWTAALRAGEDQANAIIAEHASRRSRAAARAPRRGLLVAEGDSWFDYPFHDVLAELEDEFRYTVEAVSHMGDTVESMAYDKRQLDGLFRLLQKLARDQREPKAILLSGGGNDIAGAEFALLLNHKESGLPVLNENILRGLFEERIRAAIITLANAVTVLAEQTFSKRIPILMHGYDYPVPDGRGVLGGFSVLPGPWLEPGFRRKGYDVLAHNTQVMQTIMDRFNKVLSSVAGGTGLTHVRYVNLRRTLSNELPRAYRSSWGNELHPTERGFEAVAAVFHEALEAL